MKETNKNIDYAINAIESMAGNAKKELEVLEFNDCNIFMILIMFYKPASTGMLDTGDGTTYEKIMSCLIKDDQIQLLDIIYPEKFSKVIKGEMGFIPSSITAKKDGDKITLKATISWDKWFGSGKERLDITVPILISNQWIYLEEVFG